MTLVGPQSNRFIGIHNEAYLTESTGLVQVYVAKFDEEREKRHAAK